MKAKTSKIRFTFVFWKQLDKRGRENWSSLHRTKDGIETLCRLKIHHLSEAHYGIRMKKAEPKHHALSVCQVCNSKMLNSEIN